MNFFQRLAGLFLVLTMLSASMPLSLLHEHGHIEICQVNLDLSESAKTDKDHYPVHLHTGADDCFLCFKNHQFATNLDIPEFSLIIAWYDCPFGQSQPPHLCNESIFVCGRAPPVALT